jgi:hypothetical protein
MNKKILTIIFGMCLLVMLLFYIGAEENLTNNENITVNQEENILPQTDTINILYANLDSLNSENYSNISGISTDNSNVTYENNSSVSISPSTETNETNITPSNDEITNSPKISVDNSNSGDSSVGSHAENSEYTDLSNIIQGDSQNNSENISTPPMEKTNYTYYLRGKKEIEISDYNGNGITKSEVEKSEYEKEVTVSSEEHFEGYLRVYTSLTTEAKKEFIKIYWKNNENIEITAGNEYSVEYYDEDNNGLIDRVSWTVPHLSEQTFEVKIAVTKTNESQEQILLNVINPPISPAVNPIIFETRVNYTGNTICILNISGNMQQFNSSMNYSINLPNGIYNWEINCSDIANTSIWNSTYGNFIVNEVFFVSLQPEKLYFLDLVKNIINNSDIITISSAKASNISIEIKRNDIINYSQNGINPTSVLMNKNILISAGNYTLIAKFGTPSANYTNETNFSVTSANLGFNTSQIQAGQSVNINVSINSPKKKVLFWNLYFGDGDNSDNYYPSSNSPININVPHRYTSKGNYTVSLNLLIEGEGSIPHTVQKNGIIVTDNRDTENPNVILIYPDDEEVVHDSVINFSYRANDDVLLKNCTFYLYSNCTSLSKCNNNVIYSKLNTNPQNDVKTYVGMQSFDEGIYRWEIECYDNSSNSWSWTNFFEVSLNEDGPSAITPAKNYAQKAEIDSLKAQADSFLTRDFTLEEREALDDLNVLNNTRYYQKRLIALDISLASNFSASTSELRNKKIADALVELADIKNKMPQSIVIKDNYEYIKNSVDSDLEAIVQDYFSSTNTKIGKSSVQKLAKINKELQNEVSISAKIKNVEIEYGNETQIITLVKKQIDLKNDSYTKILEVIPKGIAKSSDDVTFLTPNIIINNDPLFEINYEDLDKKEINYYIKGTAKLKDFESTETLIFEDNLNKLNSRFTGFFLVDLTSGGNAVYIVIAFVLLVILLFASVFLFKKYRMISWRKEPNVVRVMNLIEEIKKFLKEKEIEKARENYYRIKEIYPVLPSKTKAYFYEKINEMLVRIDKKDIYGLVKEYQEAKRNWNKEDYVRLYEDIKKIYGRLPEKDRKKVYEIINGY